MTELLWLVALLVAYLVDCFSCWLVNLLAREFAGGLAGCLADWLPSSPVAFLELLTCWLAALSLRKAAAPAVGVAVKTELCMQPNRDTIITFSFTVNK